MRLCPSCEAEIADSAKFCPERGTVLAVAPTTHREERKVVTVVFADLVGSTARAEHLDPEDVRARLQAAASPGAVLVSESTQRLTARAIEYGEAEPVTAKGKAEPRRLDRARTGRGSASTSPDRASAALEPRRDARKRA
jgi:class 3 adenylate cyclase